MYTFLKTTLISFLYKIPLFILIFIILRLFFAITNQGYSSESILVNVWNSALLFFAGRFLYHFLYALYSEYLLIYYKKTFVYSFYIFLKNKLVKPSLKMRYNTFHIRTSRLSYTAYDDYSSGLSIKHARLLREVYLLYNKLWANPEDLNLLNKYLYKLVELTEVKKQYEKHKKKI